MPPLFSNTAPSLFVIASEESLEEICTVQNKSESLDIRCETTPEDAVHLLVDQSPPQMLLVQAEYPASMFSGYDLLSLYCKHKPNGAEYAGLIVQLLDVHQQAQAILRGVEFILVQPISIHAFLPLLEHTSLVQPRDPHPNENRESIQIPGRRSFQESIDRLTSQELLSSLVHLVSIEINRYEELIQDQDFEQSFLLHCVRQLDDFMRRETSIAYLDRGCFCLLFEGCEKPFLSAMLEEWRKRAQQSMQAAFPHLPSLNIYINISPLGALLPNWEERMQRIMVQEVSKRPKVILIGEKTVSLSAIEDKFLRMGFEVVFEETVDFIIETVLNTLQLNLVPLIILAGPLSDIRAIYLLKKVQLDYGLHLPYIAYPKLTSSQPLFQLLDALSYVEHPFGLLIDIESIS